MHRVTLMNGSPARSSRYRSCVFWNSSRPPVAARRRASAKRPKRKQQSTAASNLPAITARFTARSSTGHAPTASSTTGCSYTTASCLCSTEATSSALAAAVRCAEVSSPPPPPPPPRPEPPPRKSSSAPSASAPPKSESTEGWSGSSSTAGSGTGGGGSLPRSSFFGAESGTLGAFFLPGDAPEEEEEVGSSSLRSLSCSASTSPATASAEKPMWSSSLRRASSSNRISRNCHSLLSSSVCPESAILPWQNSRSPELATACSSEAACARNSGSVHVRLSRTADLPFEALEKDASWPPKAKAAPAGRLSHPGACTYELPVPLAPLDVSVSE
mmetsp:Transcript_44414/g.105905  ORF Transcript_44414/g.105905 Transcript_44414/m.105905 type:complete len:330 (+) Transcript_44414:1849-2838(+)